jgi:hypothetical protein
MHLARNRHRHPRASGEPIGTAIAAFAVMTITARVVCAGL